MSGSPIAALVRGWVDLYTRGLPADARTARRDEIADDLWCEHAEAAAAGRSARSLDADLFLRLLFGMPSDISWRLAYRRAPTPSRLEGSSSMSTRTIGTLAIVAGLFPALLGILPYAMGDALWASGVGLVLVFGSFLALPAAAFGLSRRFQDRLGPVGAVGTILVILGIALIIPVPTAGFVVLPVGSAMLMWDLARIGVARRAAIVQLVASILAIGLAIGLALPGFSLAPIAVGVALYAWFLSWVAVGASLLRGMPQAQATSG